MIILPPLKYTFGTDSITLTLNKKITKQVQPAEQTDRQIFPLNQKILKVGNFTAVAPEEKVCKGVVAADFPGRAVALDGPAAVGQGGLMKF